MWISEVAVEISVVALHQFGVPVRKMGTSVVRQTVAPTLHRSAYAARSVTFADMSFQIYHLYVERLRILDKGHGDAWSLAIPTSPSAGPSSPKKCARPERDDNVDDTFNSVTPAKKSSGRS